MHRVEKKAENRYRSQRSVNKYLIETSLEECERVEDKKKGQEILIASNKVMVGHKHGIAVTF